MFSVKCYHYVLISVFSVSGNFLITFTIHLFYNFVPFLKKAPLDCVQFY